MLAWKVGAVLASGCTAVVLPSPRAVLSTLAFFDVINSIGLPPGVVNLVVGGADVGRALTESADVDMVSFTGSVQVGQQIMAAVAPRFARVVLELGGKNPMVVLPTADVVATAEAAVWRFVTNAGQMCGSTTRLLVQSRSFDEFIDCCTETIAKLQVVDPWEPENRVGALVSAAHRSRAEGFLERALAAGGTAVIGGNRPDSPGFYLNPTLVVGLENEAEINQEELFAPIATVLPYGPVDEAVKWANESRFGLNASIYGDPDEALHVAKRLQVGTVSINSPGMRRPDVPWGGWKLSGVGKELGDEGYAEFFDLQHVQWPSESGPRSLSNGAAGQPSDGQQG
jgi:aldehyde dehydrogenase (NAD+)